MKIFYLLGFAFVFVLSSLVLGGNGNAATFPCDGDTITPGNEITVDLDTVTCATSYSSPVEIEILNNGLVSGSTYQVLLAFYNGATATVSGAASGNGSGTFLSPECDVNTGCTMSVSGTDSTGPFSFNLVFPGGGSTSLTLNSTSGGPASPEISVAETGLGQGAIADGGTLGQGTQTAGSAVNLTFTVTNSGTGDLTIATATSNTLDNVTVNSISAPGSTTVTNSGGTTTFTVQYTPTLAGAFSFNLTFANDDSNENPYNFTLSGTATGTPEIAVAETGQGQGGIADGGTLGQGTQTAGSAVNLTFTVTNSGTADLTLATATSNTLSNVTVNSISAPGSTTVTGGGTTTTFTVQYTPTLAGAFSFNLTFTNNDSNENPYNFTLSGTATGAPEISVAETGQGQGAIADGGTLGQGTQTAGSAVNLTFTVTNSGTADLTLATATSNTLSNVTVNSISAPGSTTVTGGGGTTTFTVQYTPNLAGAFSFNLTFTNNDSDESPYNFTLSGTATGAPEISVAETGQGQGAVADGGTLGQGTQAAGSALTLTFTVTNSGTADLTLATATSNTLSNVTVNSITAPGSTTVTGGGGTTTFTVQYTPTLAGAYSFNLTFANNDSDENPYNFTLSGTATGAPEIAVAETGQGQGGIADGGTLGQGTQTAGSAVNLTFTVTNSGTGDLTLATATSNTLTNVTVNSISAPGSTTVTGGGGTTTFTVQYTPTLAGAFSFGLSFTNNDGDENPYNFTLSGTATGAPEISISSSEGGAVADGGTDSFASTPAATSATTVTYTITNSGTDTLTITTPTVGANVTATTNVTVNSLTLGSTTVTAGGGTTTLVVNYTPTAAAAFSFDFNFANTDSDENPFNITASGTAGAAPAPEIAVSSSEGGAVSDGGTDTFASTPAAGSASTVTYTITNSGTAALNVTTPSVGSNVTATTNVTVNSLTLASTTVASGGGTTTLTVNYTATAAGAFSFAFNFANDDSDENPFNITASGSASGAPEIAVSSSEGGAVADGGTDTFASTPTPGSAATVTYTITNSGTAALTVTAPTVGGNVSASTNVTVNSFTLGATTVASGGGTTTLVVNYTPTANGAFSFAFNFANTDGDENPYNITASGSAGGATALSALSGTDQTSEINADFGAPLVAKAVDSGGNGIPGVSVTFTAPASGASLTFASTGTNTETVTTGPDGTAASSTMTANATTSDYLGGSSFAAYSVTAAAAGLTGTTFSLTNTRDSSADITKTKEVIASFVTNRADQIVSQQPDLAGRLIGPFGRQSGLNGVFFNVTPYAQTANFQFSLRAFANKLKSPQGSPNGAHQPPSADRFAVFNQFDNKSAGSAPLGYSASPRSKADEVTSTVLAKNDTPRDAPSRSSPRSGFDVWLQGTYARTENGNDDTQSGIFFGGVDYRYGDTALIGLMGEVDITDETNSAANTAADGVGWMAGPYAVVRVHQNLYLDGRATYGQSYNSVNALGLFTDDFTTDRLLLQGGLTGDFTAGRFAFNPFAKLTYYWEEQQSYVDTLGNTIPSQAFDLGRLSFGPKVSMTLQTQDGLFFAPYLSISGIYDFDKLLDATPTNALLASSDQDIRARVEGGAILFAPQRGIKVSGEGFFDGLGAPGFKSYGGSLQLTIPF